MASRRDIRLHLRPVVHWLIILSMTLPLLSCPNPLNTAIFLHVKDSVNPVVTIQSPEDGSSYGATVVVVGKVTDDATSEEEGEVRSLSYEVVPATLPGGNVPFEEDGSFTLTFETHDFAGPMIVRLEAVDWNGNRGEAELNVVDTGAIPSFQTVPGNGSVTLSWEQVPLSAGYSLYYTDDGTAPTAFHGEEIHGVESPFLLDGLGNGRLHTFLLQSHSSEGRDNWSTRIETIPLAPLTLAPTVTGGYGSIRVEWWPIPATDEFEVLRATSEEGPYEIIAAGSLGSSVLDTDVNRGTTYYYKVRPSLAGCEDSRPNSAQLACYPSAAERIIGSCLTPGAAFDVHLRGTTAFVAAEAAGLAIVDVSNPRAPRLVSQCDTPGSAWEVALEGNYAFVADDRSGLQIIDVSNLAAPFIVGEYIGTEGAEDFYGVYGVYAEPGLTYIAGSMGVQILDVGTPSAPTLLGTYYIEPGWMDLFPGVATHVSVRGDTAYVLYEGLKILDVSNPSADPLPLLGECVDVEYEVPSLFASPHGLAVHGDTAYIADYEHGVRIVDVSSEASPFLISTYDTPGLACRVCCDGERAYVSDGAAGLQVVDITDPYNPSLAASWDMPDVLSSVVVAGGLAFAADGAAGLLVVDLLAAGTLEEIASIELPTGIDQYPAIAVHGQYAYVAGMDSTDDMAGALLVVDIGDPGAPSPFGEVPLAPGTLPFSANVGNGYAFVGHFGGMDIMDLAEPSAPVLLSTLAHSLPHAGISAAVSGAYLAAGYCRMDLMSGLLTGMNAAITDISRPEAPLFLGSTELPGASDMDIRPMRNGIRGTTAFVPGLDAGLHVVDFSDPADPRLAATCDTDGYAYQVALTGDLAVVADGDSLQIIDVSDPLDPVRLGSGLDVAAVTVTVSGDFAFVLTSDDGLAIVDISNPEQPIISGRYNNPSMTELDLAIAGEYVFVVGYDSGLDGLYLKVVDLLPNR